MGINAIAIENPAVRGLALIVILLGLGHASYFTPSSIISSPLSCLCVLLEATPELPNRPIRAATLFRDHFSPAPNDYQRSAGRLEIRHLESYWITRPRFCEGEDSVCFNSVQLLGLR